MEFPDVERAVVEVLGDTASLWLPVDFPVPAIHVYSVGGREDGVLRTDRIVVDCYAPGRDGAKSASEAVRALLIPGPHHTSEGLLDNVEAEVLPHLLPYASESVVRYTATYRVDVRPL